MKKTILTIVSSLLITGLGYAETYEKIDDSTVKITRSIEETKSISELKDELKVWKDQLDVENERHASEVLRLQAGIDERKARIVEVKKAGIKEEVL